MTLGMAELEPHRTRRNDPQFLARRLAQTWRSGARAALAAFRYWTLQVRVSAAGKGGFAALANRARRLRLGSGP